MLPPRAGVLSMDMAGPFVEAPDLFRGSKAKYFLAATFTWPDGVQDGKEEEKIEDPGCPEDAPWIEVEEEEVPLKKRGRPPKKDIEARRQKEEDEQRLRQNAEAQKALEDEKEAEERNPQETPRPELDVEYEPSLAEEGQEAEGEQRRDPKIKTYRFVTPLGSRDRNEVLKAIVDIYLRLRSAGMWVQQIHSAPLSHWCTQRTILQTYASGDQPQQNGRAEQTIAGLEGCCTQLVQVQTDGLLLRGT